MISFENWLAILSICLVKVLGLSGNLTEPGMEKIQYMLLLFKTSLKLTK